MVVYIDLSLNEKSTANVYGAQAYYWYAWTGSNRRPLDPESIMAGFEMV